MRPISYVLLAVVAASALVAAACSKLNHSEAPGKPHHTRDGFRNRYIESAKGEGFLRWQVERWRNPPVVTPAGNITGVKPDLAYLQANRLEPTATWVGHSTLLLQLDGLNILTDPVFSDHASPVSFAGPKRHQPPGLKLAELPHIDIVLISHNHYDHLDLESVRALQKQAGGPPRFYVPLGVEGWFADHVPGVELAGARRNVFWLDWDESLVVAGRTAPLQLHFLAVQHWSSRTPWDRDRTLWGSWALLHPQLRFWFAGDLGYSRDPVDIGRRFGGFDWAAIPIGGYEPRWFMQKAHINPDEAVRVLQDVGARRAIGIHWGTFEGLTDEPLDQAPKDLRQALATHGVAPERFVVLKHGETRRMREISK